MLLNFWRKSHLYFAFTSGLFLLLASLTGLVLALEPLYLSGNSTAVPGGDELTLRDLLPKLKEEYLELLSLQRDAYGNLKLEAIGEGDETQFYIDPFTAKPIEAPSELGKAVFDFNRELHRSLFLKQSGRLMMGFSAFLLSLIAVSGIFLFLRRVGSWGRFFSKVIQLDFYRDNHARLGRLFLLPILLISLSATYLSLERFGGMAPQNRDVYAQETLHATNEDFLSRTKLSELKELLFPLTDDASEYFEVRTESGVFLVDQVNGGTVKAIHHSFDQKLHDLSFWLHTAEGMPTWALVLLLSTLSLMFFIYSGTHILMSRAKRLNKNGRPDAEIQLLVGSETGQTYRFANELHKALESDGHSVYTTEMNGFLYHSKLRQLLVFSATYGDGEAPRSASRFLGQLPNKLSGAKEFSFSVLGFGSRAYPKFCAYAQTVDSTLDRHAKAKRSVDFQTVNDSSVSDFLHWLNRWTAKSKLNIKIDTDKLLPQRNPDTGKWKVLYNSFAVGDTTFCLELEMPFSEGYRSGDLLGVYPLGSHIERFYSMAVFMRQKRILLSVKLKKNGLCSNYLSTLCAGDSLEAFVRKNQDFHLPQADRPVILVANGTGLAPFLGMLYENEPRKPITLLLGLRYKSDLELYAKHIDGFLENGKLAELSLVFSQEINQPGKHVQDLLEKRAYQVAKTLKSGGQILICGSLAMRAGVFGILEKICLTETKQALAQYRDEGQVKSDCY